MQSKHPEHRRQRNDVLNSKGHRDECPLKQHNLEVVDWEVRVSRYRLGLPNFSHRNEGWGKWLKWVAANFL
jgi:hypothetical protein